MRLPYPVIPGIGWASEQRPVPGLQRSGGDPDPLRERGAGRDLK